MQIPQVCLRNPKSTRNNALRHFSGNAFKMCAYTSTVGKIAYSFTSPGLSANSSFTAVTVPVTGVYTSLLIAKRIRQILKARIRALTLIIFQVSPRIEVQVVES